MSAVGFSILWVTVAVLTALSVWANGRLRDRGRLPMQWGIGGKVNWTAPRKIALSFAPILAAAVLTLAALRYAGEPNEAGLLAIIGGAFVAAHLLYLWLVFRRA